MSVRFQTAFVGVVLASLFIQDASADDLHTAFQTRISPLLKTYCLDCHNPEDHKGELDLTKFSSLKHVQADFKVWQTVLQQVEDEEMPPKEPLPTASEREELVTWIKAALASIDWSKQTGVGRVTLPRLTKQEYNNTLRDLLGIDFRPGDMLLDDGQGLSGFNNDRDALFISPALAEQLFDAADYALEAVAALKTPPMRKVFEAEQMLMTERGSRPEELPGEAGIGYSLAGAGQRTLFDEIVVPVDGWYRMTVRCVGIGGDSGMRLRIDDEPRHDFYCFDEKPQEFDVELLLRAGSHQMTWNIELPKSLRKIKAETEARAARAAKAAKSRSSKSKSDNDKSLPENVAELVSAGARENAPQLPIPPDAAKEVYGLVLKLNRALVSMQMRIEYLRLVTPEGSERQLRNYYNLLPERTKLMTEAKQELAEAMKVSTKEIDRQLLEACAPKFESNQKVLSDSLEAMGLEYDPAFLLGNAAGAELQSVGAPGVDWIRIEGPVIPAGADTQRVNQTFGGSVDQALPSFLKRAFRRPLRQGEAERYGSLYQIARQSGESHEQALKLAFTAALTSPSFLFRDELGTNAEAFELNDHQLANRLSYFLWMSMPDDELQRLADAGELRNDTTLRSQIKRMTADPKLRAFTNNFLGQWLGFSGLGTEHIPDAKKFGDFTPELSEAMKLEPVLLFEDLLRNQGSLTAFLNGRRTFVNHRLAELYEIPSIENHDMQPVTLNDNRRGGLLGMAAILTASATPNRTSPVLRGKWVLENLLGRTLPEAPADAGQLDDQAGDRGKTLREELAQHRRNESCAGCHDKIDPIGFGLENFDAIGRFRTHEANKPVDASGELPGGLKFSGPAELRALIATRYADEFMRNLTQRLTAFALGRALKAEDEGLIQRLTEKLAASNYRADTLIESIILSDAFRKQAAAE